MVYGYIVHTYSIIQDLPTSFLKWVITLWVPIFLIHAWRNPRMVVLFYVYSMRRYVHNIYICEKFYGFQGRLFSFWYINPRPFNFPPDCGKSANLPSMTEWMPALPVRYRTRGRCAWPWRPFAIQAMRFTGPKRRRANSFARSLFNTHSKLRHLISYSTTSANQLLNPKSWMYHSALKCQE